MAAARAPTSRAVSCHLVRRLPFKRGFTNIFAIEYQEVNVDMLDARFIDGAVVNGASLVEAGLIRKADEPIKVLGRGELSKTAGSARQ